MPLKACGISCNFESLLYLLLLVISIGLTASGLSTGNGHAVSAGAVLMACASSIWTVKSWMEQTREQSSKFHLENFLNGIETAYNLLKDGNSSKVNWITAARILSRCENLSKRITHPAHRDVLEIMRDKYRHRFGQIIAGPHISPSFFFGVDKNLALKEAASEATKNQMVVNSNDEKRQHPETTEIPREAVYQIWKHAKFPKDYTEPLQDSFSDSEKLSLSFIYPSLHEWIKFTDEHIYFNGKVRRKQENHVTVRSIDVGELHQN